MCERKGFSLFLISPRRFYTSNALHKSIWAYCVNITHCRVINAESGRAFNWAFSYVGSRKSATWMMMNRVAFVALGHPSRIGLGVIHDLKSRCVGALFDRSQSSHLGFVSQWYDITIRVSPNIFLSDGFISLQHRFILKESYQGFFVYCFQNSCCFIVEMYFWHLNSNNIGIDF